MKEMAWIYEMKSVNSKGKRKIIDVESKNN